MKNIRFKNEEDYFTFEYCKEGSFNDPDIFPWIVLFIPKYPSISIAFSIWKDAGYPECLLPATRTIAIDILFLKFQITWKI
jgi:hypothetical protein